MSVDADATNTPPPTYKAPTLASEAGLKSVQQPGHQEDLLPNVLAQGFATVGNMGILAR